MLMLQVALSSISSTFEGLAWTVGMGRRMGGART
eukprot:COSAG01_NODE_67807_length_266_cov_0.544910_1_plen_33_part_10